MLWKRLLYSSYTNFGFKLDLSSSPGLDGAFESSEVLVGTVVACGVASAEDSIVCMAAFPGARWSGPVERTFSGKPMQLP
jgi:hypothetical protein